MIAGVGAPQSDRSGGHRVLGQFRRKVGLHRYHDQTKETLPTQADGLENNLSAITHVVISVGADYLATRSQNSGNAGRPALSSFQPLTRHQF